MEKTVKVVKQTAAYDSEFTRKNGEKVTLKRVGLVLSDGIDTFYAEASGSLAEELEKQPLSSTTTYRCICILEAFNWQNKSTNKEEWGTRVRLLIIKQ